MLAYILVNGMLLQSSWHIYFAVAFHVGLMLCFCWSSCQTCYAIAIHVDIYILLLQFNLAYLFCHCCSSWPKGCVVADHDDIRGGTVPVPTVLQIMLA